MSMSKELFLSILAMDAYNRGYDSGIQEGENGETQGLGVNIGNTKIGNATVFDDKGDSEAQAAGFYGIAYKITGSGTDLDGKTVISYRGTDKNDITLTGAGSDLVNGYGLAVGSYSATQVELAAKFYQSVRGDISRNRIVLTGHSMGAFQRAEARA